MNQSIYRFGRAKLPKKAIIFAGTRDDKQKQDILKNFDSKKRLPDRALGVSYIVKKGGKAYLLLFDMLGFPVAHCCISALSDGGCREAIFIGWAGGTPKTYESLKKGNHLILPNKVGCLEGYIQHFNKVKYVYPNSDLLEGMKDFLIKEGSASFLIGTSVSIPTAHAYPRMKVEIKRMNPLAIEMELSTFLYFAREEKIRAAGILIISDTDELDFSDTEKQRKAANIEALKAAMGVLR